MQLNHQGQEKIMDNFTVYILRVDNVQILMRFYRNFMSRMKQFEQPIQRQVNSIINIDLQNSIKNINLN